jgi:hypothetical protein
MKPVRRILDHIIRGLAIILANVITRSPIWVVEAGSGGSGSDAIVVVPFVVFGATVGS